MEAHNIRFARSTSSRSCVANRLSPFAALPHRAIISYHQRLIKALAHPQGDGLPEAAQLNLVEGKVDLIVLARAVTWHLEDRVLVHGNAQGQIASLRSQ